MLIRHISCQRSTWAVTVYARNRKITFDSLMHILFYSQILPDEKEVLINQMFDFLIFIFFMDRCILFCQLPFRMSVV